MSIRWAIFALLGVVLCRPCPAAPDVTTRLTPPEAPFHRAAHLTMVVEGVPTAVYEFPELEADARLLEIRKRTVESESLHDGVIRMTQVYVLDPVSPGYFSIPPLTISWQDGEQHGAVATPSLTFHARPLTDDEEEAVAYFSGISLPAEILPPRRFPTITTLFIVMAGLLAVVVVALLAWRRRKETASAVPAAPPWEVALNRLRELQRRDLPGAGKIDAYYVDLSAILRYYLEDRFHIHAPEQTTPEFLDTAAGLGLFSDEQQAFLATFLQECDRVKFARLMPDLEDTAAHFRLVRRFVQETIPVSEEEESALERAA